MFDDVLTNTREEQAAPVAPKTSRKRAPKLPTTDQFKSIVLKHCRLWHATNVNDLCTQQTQALIDELAPLFGSKSSSTQTE